MCYCVICRRLLLIVNYPQQQIAGNSTAPQLRANWFFVRYTDTYPKIPTSSPSLQLIAVPTAGSWISNSVIQGDFLDTQVSLKIILPVNAMQHHATPSHTMQRHAKPCHTIQRHTMPCLAMPYNAIQCHATPYHPIQWQMTWYDMQCNVVQRNTKPSNASQRHAMLHHVMQCHASQRKKKLFYGVFQYLLLRQADGILYCLRTLRIFIEAH